MSLYPSLEDLKVDRSLQAQSNQVITRSQSAAIMPAAVPSTPGIAHTSPSLTACRGHLESQV
ncbi:hypothetical protein FKM82_007685 [Ascaphus truei]